jgi:hypothetical protein
MTYPRSAALIAVLDELEEMDARQNVRSIGYNADARNERVDSRIIGGPDSELIPPGRGRSVHGE